MCLYGHANIDRCCCCDFKHIFRKRKGPIWDPQADLGLQGAQAERAANPRSQRTYSGHSNRSRVISEPKFRGAQAEGASCCCKTDIVCCKDSLHLAKEKKNGHAV